MHATLSNGSLIVDETFARLLEGAEGLACARFVEARQRIAPARGACWKPLAGGRAMFDGPESPLTQTFGLGLNAVPTSEEWNELEQFYADRASPVFHEISPLAPMDFLASLPDRGYRPVEWTSVMYRVLGVPYADARPVNPAISVRRSDPSESAAWAALGAAGWNADPATDAFLRDFGAVAAATDGNVPMLALLDGQPMATGSLFIADEVAILAGASTIPSARGRGAQSALLAARLQFAADAGCQLAMMCAQPGTPSQRNAQRNGFHIAYTRTKWQLSYSSPDSRALIQWT